MNEKAKGRLILLIVYLIAFVLGFWVSTVSSYSILLKSAVAVGVTVLIIFLGSVDFNNSSVFDPYWSVAPPLMALYYAAVFISGQLPAPGQTGIDAGHWTLEPGMPSTPVRDGCWIFGALPNSIRFLILFILVMIYSIRLTRNFLRGWKGLGHEDWRYAGFRKTTGKAYWLVSLFGIHLFPALMVFGGTLSIWVVATEGGFPLNWIDAPAILVTAGAILLEAMADRQMRKFLTQPGGEGKTMNSGLWACSRHPNYLGEIVFWWGLYLFALAANPGYWQVIIGPAAITVMFLFISIPMIEKRMKANRPDYVDYMKRVPMLLPVRFWKRMH